MSRCHTARSPGNPTPKYLRLHTPAQLSTYSKMGLCILQFGVLHTPGQDLGVFRA